MKQTLAHIKDDTERQFVKTVMTSTQKAFLQGRPFFTDFYNEDWMQSLILQYVGQPPDVIYRFYGGYPEAERKILVISPDEIPEEACGIGALKIEVRTGVGKALTHRDYLGAILGLGIERRLIGDIMIKPFGAYVIASEVMLDYIRSQLTGIGKYHKLDVKVIPLEEIAVESPQVKEMNVTVSSLRADAVLAVSFGISRSECTKLIQGDKAKQNGRAVSGSGLIKVGDTLTLRGYGRIRLKSVNGQTKKERFHITIEKYI